jgi:hypothetical protein
MLGTLTRHWSRRELRRRDDEAGISIAPYQMAAGEEKIVAEKICAYRRA